VALVVAAIGTPDAVGLMPAFDRSWVLLTSAAVGAALLGLRIARTASPALD
jgi:hypothetical protein